MKKSAARTSSTKATSIKIVMYAAPVYPGPCHVVAAKTLDVTFRCLTVLAKHSKLESGYFIKYKKSTSTSTRPHCFDVSENNKSEKSLFFPVRQE